MTTTIKTETKTLFMKDIQAIDFTMVKRKLQDTEEGLGWNEEECEEAEIGYHRFLALKRTYPEKDIVPTKAVDMFWHQHILDTKKYADDCDIVFGFFMHHFPYFGMNGNQDKQDLIDAFEESKELYHFHFKVDYLGEYAKCKTPKCRTACKPTKCK